MTSFDVLIHKLLNGLVCYYRNFINQHIPQNESFHLPLFKKKQSTSQDIAR